MNRRTLWASVAPAAWVRLAAFCFAATSAGSASATTTFGGGFTHVLSTEVQDDVVIIDNSTLVVEPLGQVRKFSGFPATAGANVFDTSRLIVDGGHVGMSALSTDNSTAVILHDQAELIFLGGDIRGVTGGPSDAVGVRVRDNARLFMTGGDLRASTSDPGNAIGIWISENGYVEILGGLVFGATSQVGATTAGIVAEDHARVHIQGGHIDGLPNTEAINDLVANDQSMFTIVGRDFNYPAQKPIPDLSGVITGRLGDGTFVNYRFVRSPSASIVLIVPETGTVWMGVLAMGIALCWLRAGHQRSIGSRLF